MEFCWFLRFVVIVEAERAVSQMGRLPTAFICSEDVSGNSSFHPRSIDETYVSHCPFYSRIVHS